MNKRDLNKALEWINKAVELSPEAFWMIRSKALIQADLGDKKAAIATAKIALELAKKADSQDYVKMLEVSISDWGK
jgi:regulator of sirC expression with transglutaminase-like and TPR domain